MTASFSKVREWRCMYMQISCSCPLSYCLLRSGTRYYGGPVTPSHTLLARGAEDLRREKIHRLLFGCWFQQRLSPCLHLSTRIVPWDPFVITLLLLTTGYFHMSSSSSEKKPWYKDWRLLALTGVAASWGIARLTTEPSTESRCPWPFIFAHDARQGMKDWQTWALVSVIASFVGTRVIEGKSKSD